jgi:uncharacterized membrane protein YhiD involved in acid resistance
VSRQMPFVQAILLVGLGLALGGGAAQAWQVPEGVAREAADPAETLIRAAIALPIAAVLGAALAFRPVRRGTPPRTPHVIQTQIVLAVIGALVILIVGSNLARAFGIAGVANLVRYRAKIEDPKDAAVMLAALAVGLASGAGIYLVAAGSAAFILVVLWALESLEPEARKSFALKIAAKDVAALRTKVESLLRKSGVSFEARTTGQDELSYEVELPARKRTGRLTNAIIALDPGAGITVGWEEKEKK